MPDAACVVSLPRLQYASLKETADCLLDPTTMLLLPLLLLESRLPEAKMLPNFWSELTLLRELVVVLSFSVRSPFPHRPEGQEC